MEIQSNIAASSLFDGLSQPQAQGTGTKDDLFSKMMDRMLSDSIARKRDQADAAAKDAAKDAAREARDARAEAQRKAPIRAERPRLDAPPPPRQPERPEPQTAARAETTPPAREAAKDAAPAKADEPARKTTAARTDKPAAKDTAKIAKDTAAPDKAAGTATDAATGGTDGASEADGTDVLADGNQTTGDRDIGDQTTVVDVTVTVTETVVEVVTPTASDTLLASLQLTGVATQGPAPEAATAATPTVDGDDAVGAVAQPQADPAAQLAAQLAQARQAATQGAGQAANKAMDGTTGQAADGKAATDAAPTGDGLPPAELASDAGQSVEALPTDEDAALPASFADMIAAAKAKMGEKGGARQPGTESGSQNNGQPQPQPNIAQAQAPTPAAPVLESLKSTADSQAVGALAAAAPAAIADSGAAQQTGGSHAHAALAAMEAPRAAASVDPAQAAAVLRPSRGTAGPPMGVPDQVAVHIKKNVASDVDQFTINLHPAELGRIDIKLDIGADGRVNAMVAVEKAQTLELLQRDSRGLERALQDAGLQADSNSLNFSLRGEGNPFQGNAKGGSGKRGRGFGGGDEEVAEAGTAAYTVTVGNGRLDIHA
ncbi:hypothetical protein J2847_002437 [Azospirillum agricola]|uniref:flagellar hook-length control protein FliK n=1 Tax=Azospirillum agricola TaxID=1720247 RepID=UPI001AE97A55|nr:flagellar hook-length control protein FliK [Azospirillum agricola]MBP2229143.1 hypothetical protein [Azospirillum agricola]